MEPEPRAPGPCCQPIKLNNLHCLSSGSFDREFQTTHHVWTRIQRTERRRDLASCRFVAHIYSNRVLSSMPLNLTFLVLNASRLFPFQGSLLCFRGFHYQSFVAFTCTSVLAGVNAFCVLTLHIGNS
jgi:hypothetical protein